MKKKFLPWFLLGLSFISLECFSDVVRIQIPYFQKNVVLQRGTSFKFDCYTWDNSGNHVQVQLEWKLVDSNGFQTGLPGWISNTGFFTSDPYFVGAFKVVVTEPASNISDEAFVQVVENAASEIARIEVFPTSIVLNRGSSAYVSVRCYDRYGFELSRFTLRYYLRDRFGQIVPGYFATVDYPGVLTVSPYAWPGSYTLHFEDVNGSAFTILHLHVI